jgi:hypothetical protein
MIDQYANHTLFNGPGGVTLFIRGEVGWKACFSFLRHLCKQHPESLSVSSMR